MDSMYIKLDNQYFEQGVKGLGRIYHHPQANEHIRQAIWIELHRIFGPSYDIKEFLDDKKYLFEDD